MTFSTEGRSGAEAGGRNCVYDPDEGNLAFLRWNQLIGNSSNLSREATEETRKKLKRIAASNVDS